MDADLRQAVQAVYAAAEVEIAAAGPVCVASGRCCRFQEWGHTLFLSSLEAELLLTQPPPREGLPADGSGCPYQVEKLCTAREVRPLGCRVYYCDPSYQETGRQISEKCLRQLKDLADARGLPWRYAPLEVYLNEAATGSLPGGRGGADSSIRSTAK